MTTMQTISSRSASSLFVMGIGITALATLALQQTETSGVLPSINRVIQIEETTTPKIEVVSGSSWIKEAQDVLNGIRGFTKEEAELHEEGLNRLFQPTGRNLFDL